MLPAQTNALFRRRAQAVGSYSRHFLAATKRCLPSTAVRPVSTTTSSSSSSTSSFSKRVLVGTAAAAAIAAGASLWYAYSSPISAEQRLSDFGVWAWGYNGTRVVAPQSKQEAIKTPQRVPFFDGMELRDLQLGDKVGAAVTAKGDVLVWGTGFDANSSTPLCILTKQDIATVQISQGRIYALTRSGNKLFSLPASKLDLEQTELKYEDKRWFFGLFAGFSRAHAFRTVQVPLRRGEKIAQIAAGDAHLLMLSSTGRVFSCATGSRAVYSTDGQLGVPVLLGSSHFGSSESSSSASQHEEEEDFIVPEQVHEVATLRGFPIAQIAAGAKHSLARAADGRVWVFGSNLYGQLGMDYSVDTAFIPIPALLSLDRLYNTRGAADVSCRYIAAGGDSSLFAVQNRKKGVAEDVWVCGAGLHGQHGSGRFNHTLGTPQRVRQLCSITEYSEKDHATREIPIRSISVGKRHIAAVLDNITAPSSPVQRQLLIWGGNDWFQLGTGKRVNSPVPIPIVQSAKKAAEAEEAVNLQKQLGHGKSRKGYEIEESVVCGNFGTAIYWRVV
ncbi:regulator of chromosome condensation 1/beta-lactamase-inhibitor protein II [Myxozyma melibiosi]|uniref:Regulator of chromosome condensation 1/beta-lactamase-inhibitor protein II n=1 Tax=Myxozyma melibiosi TaxID=54550 RepID=A0ABR1F7B5_9ASCO